MSADETEANCAALVAREWNLTLASRVSTLPMQREWLLDGIAAKVQQLIEGDPKALYQVLYRLDVDEERSGHILRTQRGAGQARALAELILRREWQKAKTRMEYESEDGEDGPQSKDEKPTRGAQPRLPEED